MDKIKESSKNIGLDLTKKSFNLCEYMYLDSDGIRLKENIKNIMIYPI